MKLEVETSKIIEIPDIFSGSVYERLKRSLLAILLGQKDNLWQGQHDPDGTPWQPLSKKAAGRKNKKAEKLSKKQTNTTWNEHKILVDTGALQNSMSIASASGSQQSTDGDEVVIGTNLPYAAIHNFGGTVKIPMIKNGFGMGIEIPAHTVTIPARPFIGFGKGDEDQISEKLESYVAKQGKGA